jgi:hypothetical protein
MNKLIILTTSIIRGDFHNMSIGKFYDYFYKYFEQFEIYHIINIDEPENLKKYFNKYETIYNYDKIIPEKVNKIYINENNPGFLRAYKKIINKIEELNLLDDNYIYYWSEDDWEPKNDYNIVKFFDFLKCKNSAYTFTDKAPLGSFRGGPFMTGSYFKNIFNIKKYMNETCDPERQMQRWLRGGNNKNGNVFIHRLSIQNDDIQNDTIHIIIVCKKCFLNISDINISYYNSGYDKSIKFYHHVLSYDSDFNLQHSLISNDNKYDLKNINHDELLNIFNNDCIKYFIIKPTIFEDIGRKFNEKYELKKWLTINDDVHYSNINFYNANLGNWKLFSEEQLRLKPNYTMNKGFFSSIAYIHQCLPYLEQNYFNKNINLNILYYSHNYGDYPNFQVIGDLIQLNYKLSINKNNEQFDELTCFGNLMRKICGTQTSNEDNSLFSSFKNNFKLANYYWFKYFKFNDDINNIVEQFIKKFNNNNVLGLHFRGTDKNKVNWVTRINIDEFIQIVDYHLSKNKYDIIFISTDDEKFIKAINIKYGYKYIILCYDDYKNNENNNSIHLDRLEKIVNLVGKINDCKKDLKKTIELENKLKEETKINKILLQDVIINSIILSKCNCVLKTHSQVSAYSKIFNPELEIYRINSCKEGYWPDSHIPLYNYENIENMEIKNLLQLKLSNEFDETKKSAYGDFE